MAKGKDKTDVTKVDMVTDQVCLNNMTVGNLKKYLDRFPDDAKVVITGTGNPDYLDRDAQLACNTKHQLKNNVVQFILGRVLE